MKNWNLWLIFCFKIKIHSLPRQAFLSREKEFQRWKAFDLKEVKTITFSKKILRILMAHIATRLLADTGSATGVSMILSQLKR